MWSSALKKRGGSKVPMPWDFGVKPNRGNLVVVMGSPGVGKSLFGLNWCLGIDEPSVLVSLDTDMTTQAARACGILANANVHRVEESPIPWAQYLDRSDMKCRMYDLSLTPRDMSDLVMAETEYWGDSPGLVVVDNVSNVVRDTTYEAYRSTFIELQKVARIRGVVVVALHHVKRDSSSPYQPLHLHSGQYAGEQEAELVLGLWRSTHGVEVGILKNRNGLSDPSGGLAYTLSLNHSTLKMRQI